MPFPPAVRPLLVLLALVLASWSVPRPAAAQGFCTDPGQCGPPTVSIDPAEGSWSGAAASLQLVVTVSWCDEQTALVPTSAAITLDGAPVTGAFTYQGAAGGAGCASAGTSIGTVTLTPGTHTLTARIRNSQHWGQSAATYTYTQTGTPPGGGASVSVTPDARAAVRGVEVKAAERFVVANTGNAAATFALAAACPEPGSACAATHSRVTLAPGATAAVGVTYTTPAVHATATVMLKASAEGAPAVRDSGSYAVTARYGESEGLASDVGETVNVNRADCVMLPAALAGVYECGDLRLAVPLPAVRALNRSFAPTLVYNSQHAFPFPIVGANVTPRAGTTPTAVVATLTFPGAGGARPPRRFAGWEGGTARRVAVGVDASGMESGVYAYRLLVEAEYGTARDSMFEEQGELVVVNRAASRFGAGWWLAGLEELKPLGDGRLLWIGGDGSTQRYKGDGPTANRWYAEAYDGADTIVFNPADHRYRRILPGGDTVFFTSEGRHVATVNRHGHRTVFEWQAGGLTVRLPTASGGFDTGQAYTFVWGNAGGRLSRVEAPGLSGPRVVTVGMDGQGRVNRFGGPDTTFVRLGYPDATPRVSWWEDRRHVVSYFYYDAGSKLRFAIYPTAPGGPNANQIYNAQESWGIDAPVPLGWLYTGYNGPRDDVPDYTFFYVNRRGAPTGIVNAEYRLTEIFRQDPRWPGLVTKVRHPNGRVLTATYDDAGRATATTDWATRSADGRFATTLYEWDERCGAVARVTLPEGEQTTRGYDARCRLEWVQPGPDPARRTRIGYFPSTDPSAPGLVASVTSPAPTAGAAGPRESYAYDARGNLRLVLSPTGVRREVLNDALGRVIRTSAQIDSAGSGAVRFQTDTLVYDGMDRVVRSESFGPALDSMTVNERLVVVNEYDNGGNVLSVTRSSSPDAASVGAVTTRYEYDAAGRRTAEIAPDATPSTWADNPVDRTFYDLAGNPVRVRSRRYAEIGADVTLEYDALNRLVRRVVPEVRYDSTYRGIPAQMGASPLLAPCGSHGNFFTLYRHPYPLYPNQAGCRYVIAQDVAVFEYDEMGRLTRADNRDASVRRTYYPNGLLKTDSLVIRTVAGGGAADLETSPHRYGIANSYDLDGRRTSLAHPAQLAVDGGVSQPPVRYTFNALGELDSVSDPLGNVFRYAYHLDGSPRSFEQLPSAGQPPAYWERYEHDAEGRLRRHQAGAGATFYDLRLRYDGRGKVLEAFSPVGPGDSTVLRYSGLGNLVHSAMRATTFANDGRLSVRRNTERFVYDALDHRTLGRTEVVDTVAGGAEYSRVPSNDSQAYQAGTGRQVSGSRGGRVDTYRYDAAGNTTFYGQPDDTARPLGLENRVSYYGADGRLRAADYRSVPDASVDLEGGKYPYRMAFEEFWYDALGRRVLVRARRYGRGNTFPDEAKLSFVRRTIWDGDAELWEIQMPDTDALRENDAGPVPDLEPAGEAGGYVDPNPFYGRVAYTYAGALDRPVSVTRFGYGDEQRWAQKPFRPLGAFSIVPLWDHRGRPVLGTYGRGQLRNCAPGEPQFCVYATWPALWFAYYRDRVKRSSWHGELLADKNDHSGTAYRRNRYYDPGTGKFTQEDPIGLAGGLNVYGFANGDPVRYADPYGLCPQSMRDANDRCPGGLSVDQYDDIRAGAQANLLGGARTRILAMLDAGDIRLVGATGNGMKAGANVWQNHMSISVTAEFFGTADHAYDTRVERSWVLAHELGHIVQRETRDLIYLMPHGPVDSYLAAPTGTPLHNAMQRDADRYACAHTVEQGTWTQNCTP